MAILFPFQFGPFEYWSQKMSCSPYGPEFGLWDSNVDCICYPYQNIMLFLRISLLRGVIEILLALHFLQGPIGTVFGQRALTHYLMLFNALWRAKRMEWILSCVWTRQTGMHKMMIRTLPELKPILHLANLLSSEMVHFVNQV
jgi:hypothetical protein